MNGYLLAFDVACVLAAIGFMLYAERCKAEATRWKSEALWWTDQALQRRQHDETIAALDAITDGTPSDYTLEDQAAIRRRLFMRPVR